jgi:hypothetical protein
MKAQINVTTQETGQRNWVAIAGVRLPGMVHVVFTKYGDTERAALKRALAAVLDHLHGREAA